MAKMFFNAQEAARRLNMSDKELKDLVREGKLREFRDAGNVNYKVDDIEKLAASGITGSGAAAPVDESEPTDEIVLEPAEPEPSLDESGVELAPAGSDVLSLDEVDSEGTRTGAKEGTAAKEGSVVSSVGVSVFDDDELDEIVDPLAQTQVSDAGALGMEGVGSGSGILDLTRERDDTSLGAELLDEIYTGEEESGVEMGDDTRTGLEGVEADEEGEEDESFTESPAGVAAPAAAKQTATVRQVVEYGPDAVSSALTAMMAVAVVVMLFAGLGAAALVQGVKPAILATISNNMLYFGGGSVLVAIIAAAVAFLLAKRSG